MMIWGADDGVICAYRIDPGQDAQDQAPAVQSLTGAEIEAALRDGRGLVWLHLNVSLQTGRAWLQRLPDVPPAIIEDLLDGSQQLHYHEAVNGYLITLRDLHYEAEIGSDRIGLLRLWIDRHRVVSVRRHPLKATDQLRRRIAGGAAPGSSVVLLAELLDLLAATFAQVAAQLAKDADAVEDALLDERIGAVRSPLGIARRRAAHLLRQIAPQRRGLARLQAKPPAWFTAEERQALANALEHVGETVDLIQVTQERCKVMQEELTASLAEQTNHNLYILSVVSVIILPMTLLTGVFGMNVAGMPGLESGSAFWIVCGLILAIGTVTVIVLKWLDWF